MKRSYFSRAATACLLFFAASYATADLVTFKQGATNALTAGSYTGVDDNILNELSPSQQNGAATSGVLVGVRPTGQVFHSLMRFNLGSLTEDVVVTSDATLKIQTINTTQSSATLTVEMYSLLPASGGWDESTSTWNDLDNTGPTAWAGSPGASTAGTDYDASLLDSAVKNLGTGPLLELTIPAAQIQSWIDNPSTNYGLLFKEANEIPVAANDFVQAFLSDSANTNARPSLTFNYSLAAIPEPSTQVLLFSAFSLLWFLRRLHGSARS